MHLYLHVPYCIAKCPYCDFNSIAGRDDEHAAYVEALVREIRTLPRGPYATVFLGGGTPTLLSAALLDRFLSALQDHITWAPNAEFTCEANPGSADAERFAALVRGGVNRISLGVQSTHDHHLRTLGRVHSASEAEKAIVLARASVPRVSADLIIGLEGQTDAEVDADLALYDRHDLEHASVYHLTYEPGTEFHAKRGRGEMRDIAPERSRTILLHQAERLLARGLRRYETSNFARPGQESRHNLAYWHGRDYYAAGAGAVSTIAGVRSTREKHPAQYIKAINANGDATWRSEILTPSELLAEAWMLGLRLADGLPLSRVDALGDNPTRYQSRLRALADEGLLELTQTHVRLSESSWPLLDEIAVYVMP